MSNDLPEAVFELDYYPSITEEEINSEEYIKIPFDEIESLGAAFAAIPDVMGKITKTVDVDGLYEIANMAPGSHLAEAKDGSGLLGMCFDSSNKLVGNATFRPVDSVKQVASVSVDPTLLFMTAIMMKIDYKLDVIQETQKEILTFLNRDKETKLEGDVKTLVDIINNCKYNWDNDIFKRNNHKQAGDIKKEAQQNILFYRKAIKGLLNKKKGVLTENKMEELMKRLKSNFKYYQLSVYLFSFASFLEVLLLGNYESDYIKSVVSKLEEASFDYRKLYTDSYNKIERLSERTAEAVVLDGAAFINKTIGKTISKIPVVKKTPIDEALIGMGRKMDAIGDRNVTNRLDLFDDSRDSGVNMFIDHCNMLEEVFNRPKLVLVDNDALYLRPIQIA